MEISGKIQKLRKKNKLTLEEVGKHVGVGKSTVRKWETGDIANIKANKIVKLAEVLHTSPEYLLGLNEDEELSQSENILQLFNQLNNENKRTIENNIVFLLAEQQKQSCPQKKNSD